MKILVDTTYLLPILKINIENIDKKIIKKLFKSKQYTIYLSHISLMELIAKGAKLVTKGLIEPNDVLEGVNAIKSNEKIHITDYLEKNEVILTALNMRKFLNDFIDCIIVATAIHYTDILLTEDKEIHKLKENKSFITLLKELKKDLKILSINQLEKLS